LLCQFLSPRWRGDSTALLRETGYQTGEFMGMPPTSKSISVGVIDIFRIAEGKIVEHWGLADMMGMMQRLGAMPAPGAS